MKYAFFFLAIAMSVCHSSLAQVTAIREFNQQDFDRLRLKPGKIQFDRVDQLAGAPDVAISLEPKEGEYLLYHPTPGFTSLQATKAQLSLLAFLHNKETENVDLDKVVFEYKQGNSSLVKTITLPADKQIVEPGYVRVWQNGRDYHKTGDVVYLDSPLPSEVRLKFYFKNFSGPVTVVKKLKAFKAGFGTPFKAADLKNGEYWSSYSMHGGGGQVFAYDLGVSGYADGTWSDNLQGTTGSENTNKRVWGKPVYAS